MLFEGLSRTKHVDGGDRPLGRKGDRKPCIFGGRNLLFPVIVLVVVLVAVMVADAEAQEEDLEERMKSKESELQKLRKRIAEQRRRIKEVEREEKDVSGYLRKLEEEEKLTRKLLDGLAEKGDILIKQVEDLRKAIGTNEMVYEQRVATLIRRLREIYKDGPRSLWQELLDANDFADLLQRYKFLTLIAESDAALVNEVRKRKTEIECQEAGVTELLHEVTVAHREKEDELERLEDNGRKQEKTLTELKKRKKGHEREIGKLAKAEKEVQNFIAELEKRRLEQAKAWGAYGEQDFPHLRGKLPKPVGGRVVREFGRFKHPEFGTVTFNSGINIEAAAGSPVCAVARGRVSRAPFISR